MCVDFNWDGNHGVLIGLEELTEAMDSTETSRTIG